MNIAIDEAHIFYMHLIYNVKIYLRKHLVDLLNRQFKKYRNNQAFS